MPNLFMDPEQFKAVYNGSYKKYFKYIKPNHNRFMRIKTMSKFIKVMNKMNYYGVIYKITQVKDSSGKCLYGVSPSIFFSGKEIKQGLNRIGKTKELKYRFSKYLWSSKNKPTNNFEIALASFSRNKEDISKSFKIELLAVCKNKKEYDATEIFWTLYLNRKNIRGYNLAQNLFFNPIVGDLKDYQTVDYFLDGTLFKYKVVRDLLNGYQLSH